MMRTLLITVGAAAAVFVGGTSAITAQSRGPARPLLYPLSWQDQDAARGNGCQLSFDAGRRTYVYVIGHSFMIKTGSGRAVCRISDAQFAALSEGGSQSCQGLRLTVRRTGPSVANEPSDSASAPAMLTVTGERGQSWSLRGQWGSAC